MKETLGMQLAVKVLCTATSRPVKTSLVPRPSRFLFLFCSLRSVYYMEAEEQRKTGKAWEHLSYEWRLVDARWTYVAAHLQIDVQ